MNIIGDIAGQFNALKKLLKKMPQDEKIILVGDLNDRGLQSKEVIEWAMNTPNITALQSNHGQMFTDFYRYLTNKEYRRIYHTSDFFNNGGIFTLISYGLNGGKHTNLSFNQEDILECVKSIPIEHIEWLESLPSYYRDDEIFVSHAPWHSLYNTLEEAQQFTNTFSFNFDNSLIWNRSEPKKRDRFQIFGHNSHWGIRKFGDWAICIDDSQKNKLTGIHWPSRDIYQESFKVKKVRI